jgi:hypothetical protein
LPWESGRVKSGAVWPTFGAPGSWVVLIFYRGYW